MISKLKRLHKSKTMWWALVIVILGVISDNLSYFHEDLGDRGYGFLLMAIGIVTAILRFNTSKPLDEM